MIEAIGFASAFLLAVCGIPQAWKSWKTKSSAGVSFAFLGIWLAGEILLLAYASARHLGPMMVNASLNIMIIGIILRYPLDRK
jgi:uncharacterized protein with PQ loop repeat